MVLLALVAMLWVGCLAPQAGSDYIQVEPFAEYQADSACAEQILEIRAEKNPDRPLYERYKDIRVIDVHNHDADRAKYALAQWDQFYIDQTVLFGNISEPAALATDLAAMRAYGLYPDRIVPFFAGVPIYEADGLEMVRENLEKGYFGIGEIVGASTYSPAASQLEWKSEHPNDGNLPDIYKMCAEYKVPVLLHIDPPDGVPIQMLEQALIGNPDTALIFAHANAYNTPQNIEALVSGHSNLYIDFFAGFTAYSPDSSYELADFVPVIEQYPDQFLVGTDSGYGTGYDKAALAIYELLDLLAPDTACKVSHQNFARLVELQLPTETQVSRIKELSAIAGESATLKLNKRTAHELLFRLEGTVSGASE
jgi:predicted TIM-barrel fold metal-dependent hydrolase